MPNPAINFKFNVLNLTNWDSLGPSKHWLFAVPDKFFVWSGLYLNGKEKYKKIETLKSRDSVLSHLN